MDDSVFITAQEAAERLLTIKIAGFLMFALLIFAVVWLFFAWKYSEDRRMQEAKNDADRIAVTKTLGKSLTDSLKEDGNWKEQFFILQAKYDVLEAHCENMEKVLDSAKGRNGFQTSGVAR